MDVKKKYLFLKIAALLVGFFGVGIGGLLVSCGTTNYYGAQTNYLSQALGSATGMVCLSGLNLFSKPTNRTEPATIIVSSTQSTSSATTVNSSSTKPGLSIVPGKTIPKPTVVPTKPQTIVTLPQNTTTPNSGSIEPVTSTVKPTAPTTPIIRAELNYDFGISFAQTLSWLSDDELKKQLDDVAELGVGWIRFDISWSSIQPRNPDTYNWGPIDRLVKEANIRKIRLLPILTYTPSWARLSSCQSERTCQPANPALFADFAAVAVRRYSPLGVKHWEIWNEPNLKGFWKPEANVVDYVNLLKLVYPAIKNADATAGVITGGTGPAETKNGNIAPIDFLKGIYEQDGKSFFDAVGHHPYSYPAPPTHFVSWSGWSQMTNTNPSLRSVMEDNGDSWKRIWMTEIGAPTGGPGAVASIDNWNFSSNPDHQTEDMQAHVLIDAFKLRATFKWSGPMFWYSYKDIGTSKNTNENFFGIIRYDGSKKPAYDALKKLINP